MNLIHGNLQYKIENWQQQSEKALGEGGRHQVKKIFRKPSKTLVASPQLTKSNPEFGWLETARGIGG